MTQSILTAKNLCLPCVYVVNNRATTKQILLHSNNDSDRNKKIDYNVNPANPVWKLITIHRATKKLWNIVFKNLNCNGDMRSPMRWLLQQQPGRYIMSQQTVITFLVSTCGLKSNCISHIFFAHHLHLPVTIFAAWLPSKQNVSQPVTFSANQELHLAADTFFFPFFASQDSSCTATIWFCPFLRLECWFAHSRPF